MAVQSPLRRYDPAGDWEWIVNKDLTSPAPDGSVVYYQDSLSPLDGEGQYIDGAARALCQCLMARVLASSNELVDGPYLQPLEDDGTVPPGWQMLRALVWVDEFDLVTPLTPDAVAGARVV